MLFGTSILSSIGFKLIAGVLIIGSVYVVSGQIIDTIGKGGALKRELEIRDRVIEEKNRVVNDLRDVEQKASKDLIEGREEIQALRERNKALIEDQTLNTEEIPPCPVICRPLYD